MKRARETTTPVAGSKPSPAKSSNATLEEIRAKLEQARLKKIAAEERLLRQKQQQQEEFPKTPNSKREAQQALDRARSKLQGALQNRERALQQQQWNRKRNSFISLCAPLCAPISALDPSFALKITNISQTGPPEMVYHYEDSLESPSSTMGFLGSRMALEAALGGKQAVEALHKSNYNVETNQNDTSNNNMKKRKGDTNANKKQTASLLQRKIQLQNELLALKEKLEMKASQEQKQKENHQKDSTPNPDSKSKITATKEGLERRKAEAQTIMDISYWKHFVSKQEHLLEQVTAKLKTTEKSYKECLQTRHATNKAIAKVQQNLEFLQQRQAVVEEGMLSSTQTLLQARQELHSQTTNEGGKAHARDE